MIQGVAAMSKFKKKPRRLAVEGLETRLALVGDSLTADFDEDGAPLIAIAQIEAATSRGETARLASGRDTSARTATPYRPVPVLRATGVRRGPQPRESEIRVAAAPVAEGVPIQANGDFNGDLTVDRGDVAVLAANLGLEPAATFEDGELSGDGKVGLADLARMVFSSPALDIALTTNVTSVDNSGDTITFTYTVRNVGNSPLSGVSVTDDRGRTPIRQPDTIGDGDNLLEFGETWRYTANYTVVQADLAAGEDLVTVATVDSDQTGPATGQRTVHNVYEMPEISIGDVRIIPIDHASFVMTWNGITIYSDPVGGAGLYTGLPPADLVLVTHQHGDHYNAGTISGIDDSDVRIITSQTVFNLTSFAALRPMTTTLAYGNSTTVHGVTVTAVHAYDNNNHGINTGNGYVVTLGDQRIYIAGDTGPVAQIRALDDIDVAFLCMNTPFTMNVTEGASVTRDIAPRYVIPYHYRNGGTPVTYADLNNFKTLVGTDLGINVRVLDWY
jgi:L-ascorbate metabolism protein UlaG (beta-lactamase superfamily)